MERQGNEGMMGVPPLPTIIAVQPAALALPEIPPGRSLPPAGYYKKIYDRASALAKIGMWECRLTDNHLIWTDGVYDLFDIPRGTLLDREATAALYDDSSRREMERLRANAISERRSFTMDARICTPKGNVRWIRLSADVECEHGRAVRLFGAKQDVTDERALWEQLRNLAERDGLTGLANRSLFQSRFAHRTPDMPPLGALMLIDLDHFKQVNDRFGHSAGDECLRVLAGRLSALWGDRAVVARIGGDEFAVLVPAPCTAKELLSMAHAMRTALRLPVAWRGHMLPVGASIGLALTGPGHHYLPEALFAEADSALYAAKSQGRDGVQIYFRDASAA